VAILGYFYGITGVGVAALLTVVVVELGTVPYLCKRLGVPSRIVFASVLRSHVLPVLLAGALGIYLSAGPVAHYVDVHGRLAGLVAVVIAGALVLVVYAGVFAITGLQRSERAQLMVHLHRSS
jgi:hypothetical protein